jgi:hypothetical protein
MADRNKRKVEFQDFTINKTILNCNLALITFRAKVRHILNKNVILPGELDKEAEDLCTFHQWSLYKERVEAYLFGMLKSKSRRPDFLDVVSEIFKLRIIDGILDNDAIYGYTHYRKETVQKKEEEYIGIEDEDKEEEEEDKEDKEDKEEKEEDSIPENKPYTGLHDKDCKRVYTSIYSEYPMPKGRLGALIEVFQEFEQTLAREICPQQYWLGIKFPENEALLWNIKTLSEQKICNYFVKDMSHKTARYLIKHLYIRRSCLQELERLHKIKTNLWCKSFDLPSHECQRSYKLE